MRRKSSSPLGSGAFPIEEIHRENLTKLLGLLQNDKHPAAACTIAEILRELGRFDEALLELGKRRLDDNCADGADLIFARAVENDPSVFASQLYVVDGSELCKPVGRSRENVRRSITQLHGCWPGLRSLNC